MPLFEADPVQMDDMDMCGPHRRVAPRIEEYNPFEEVSGDTVKHVIRPGEEDTLPTSSGVLYLAEDTRPNVFASRQEASAFEAAPEPKPESRDDAALVQKFKRKQFLNFRAAAA